MEDENDLILYQKKLLEWDEGAFIVLVALIILIPIVFYPYCIPPFETAKILVFQSLVFVGFTLLVLKSISSNSLVWTKTHLDKPILIYLIFGSLSLVWSMNIYHSVMSLPLFLSGPVLYYVISNLIQEQKKIDRLLCIIIVIGTGMGAYGILQYLGIDFEFWTGNVARKKVFGLFGNVNYFAEYLILPLSLAIGIFLSKKKMYYRFLLLFSLFIMGVALFLTFTRGSYLAIAVSIPIILLFYYKSASVQLVKQYYQKVILYFLLIIIIALAIIFIPHPLNKGNAPIAQLRSRVSIETLTSGNSVLRRIATWKFTWMMIKDYFLLGSGLGTYDYHSLKYQADFFALNHNRDIYPHGFAVQAHNEYLQLWSELGLIGLLFFLWILFVFYKNLLLNLKKEINEKLKTLMIGLAGGVTAILIDAIFGFPLQLAASLSLFWVFLGLTGAQLKIVNSIEKDHVASAIKKQELADNNQISSHSIVITLKKILLSLLAISIMVFCILLFIKLFMARVYWYHGNQQILQENYNKAIQIYEKGLKWNPWQGEMYYDIGNIMASKGINQPALEYYQKAEKYVDHHRLPQNIAFIYIKRGEMSSAIPYLEQAIKYQEDEEGVLSFQLQLGNIYLTLKEYQKAEQIFDSALKTNPDSAEAYYGLSGAYLNQGKREQAIEKLQKVIEISPESKVAGYAKVLLKKMELEGLKK